AGYVQYPLQGAGRHGAECLPASGESRGGGATATCGQTGDQTGQESSSTGGGAATSVRAWSSSSTRRFSRTTTLKPPSPSTVTSSGSRCASTWSTEGCTGTRSDRTTSPR